MNRAGAAASTLYFKNKLRIAAMTAFSKAHFCLSAYRARGKGNLLEYARVTFGKPDLGKALPDLQKKCAFGNPPEAQKRAKPMQITKANALLRFPWRLLAGPRFPGESQKRMIVVIFIGFYMLLSLVWIFKSVPF